MIDGIKACCTNHAGCSSNFVKYFFHNHFGPIGTLMIACGVSAPCHQFGYDCCSLISVERYLTDLKILFLFNLQNKYLGKLLNGGKNTCFSASFAPQSCEFDVCRFSYLCVLQTKGCSMCPKCRSLYWI